MDLSEEHDKGHHEPVADDAIKRALREDLTIDFPTTQALVAWLTEQGRDLAPWQLPCVTSASTTPPGSPWPSSPR